VNKPRFPQSRLGVAPVQGEIISVSLSLVLRMIQYTIEADSSRERARKTIKEQAFINETLKCSVPGCEAHRRGISVFCKAHQYSHQNRGHPLLRLPVGNERRAMLAEGKKMLAWLAGRHGKERVEGWCGRPLSRSAPLPAWSCPQGKYRDR
jgi:hypothetical protein